MKRTITFDEIARQIRDTQQVHFELTALSNWIDCEEPRNATNMREALNHVYAALESNRRAFDAMNLTLTAHREEREQAQATTENAVRVATEVYKSVIERQARELEAAHKKLALFKRRDKRLLTMPTLGYMWR